jgi:methylated-DNA-[protein]-cysteine S-methyltransferase
MADETTIYFSRMNSPVGSLLLAATRKGLRRLHFDRGTLPPAARNELWIESPEFLQPYVDQMNAYFRGELREFTGQLELIGTPFQKDCWEALLRIPYGTTCSYADIARAIGRPKAFRAVGMANHDNPIAIIVPCHRVLGASGLLTGYGGGLSTKKKLLRLEGAKFLLEKFSLRITKEEDAPRQSELHY